MSLSQQAIPRPTEWCVTRPQEHQYVVYNTQTDELYLLSPAAFYVYQLCDGVSRICDLADLLKEIFEAPPHQTLLKLGEFLTQLAERGIVEIEGEHGSS